MLAMDRGDYAHAEQMADKALQMQRRLGGDKNPDDASSMIVLGLARSLRNDLAGAEPVLRQALGIRKDLFPPGHVQIIGAEIRLGEVLASEGKIGEAEPILREAATAAHQSPFRLPAWQVAEADNALGACLARAGPR